MKNFSVWKIVKARWGWRDVRHWLVYSSALTGLKLLIGGATLTFKGVAVTQIWALPIALFIIYALYFLALYMVYFLGSVGIYSIVTLGANRDHPGYRQMYAEYLSGE